MQGEISAGRTGWQQLVRSLGLMVAEWALLAACCPQTGAAQRLNSFIARAERGELIISGEDYEFLPDQEHDYLGVLKLGPAMEALRPPGSSHPTKAPVVRIALDAGQVTGPEGQHRQTVKEMLDIGVMGIIFPEVKSADNIRELIKDMRYPPQRAHPYPAAEHIRGVRGLSGAAPGYWGLTAREEYILRADVWPLNPEGELLALFLIETPEAVNNIKEILEVPGLGGVVVGLVDLSMHMGVGVPGNPNVAHPEVLEAVEKVALACAAHHRRGGKVVCGIAQLPMGYEKAVSMGFTWFFAGRAGAAPLPCEPKCPVDPKYR